MDVENFINLVYEHKCLWDQSDPSYHLRDLQRRAWREISEEMEISVDELKKKWRGLRDTFGKELRKLDSRKSSLASDTEPDSKWLYFELLLFLRSTMSRRDLKSGALDCEISGEENSEIAGTSTNCADPSTEIDRRNPKRTKFHLKRRDKRRQSDEIDKRLEEIEDKLNRFQGGANDPDAQFLMSLLPFLKDIPKHRKLMVRAKIQQVLIDEQDSTQ